MNRAIAFLIVTALTGAGVAENAHAKPAWPMFKHDAGRSGRTPTTGPQTNAEKWTAVLANYGIQAQLALGADGTVYSGSVRGDFYAFSPDGSIKWRRHLGRHQITAGAALSPGGTIYIASEDGILHAFSKHGAKKWTFDLAGYAGPSASPVIGPGGILYVGAAKLFAIDEDGSLAWSYDTGGAINGPPALDRAGTLYFPSTDYLYAVNSDGTLKWRSKGHAAYPLGGAPAIGKDGTIYVNTYDGVLHAYSASGKFKWKFSTPGIVVDVPSSPATATDGTIYFGGRGEYQGKGGYFYAVNPDGTLKWRYHAGCAQTAPTVGGDGTVYFGSDWCGTIHALNPDGTDKWLYENGFDYVRSAPVIAADGTLYAGLLAGPLTPDKGGLIALGP